MQATGCNKTDFNGYDTPSDKYLVDCRSNPDYPGDLFTWEAVNQYKADLCPDGWHVPTAEDFSTLDITLHGSDVGTWYYTDTAVVRNKYINTWGGSYGGACSGSGALNSQDLSADYWSQSEYSRVGYGLCLRFKSDGTVSPQGGNCMHFGLALRCVR